MPRYPERLYDGHAFDLDGTIYLGEELLPGAMRLIFKLRELDRRVVFLSNNQTRDPKMYAEKLTRLCLQTPAAETVNPVVTITRWLLQSHPDATVLPIAEEPLKDALRGAGIKASESPTDAPDYELGRVDRLIPVRPPRRVRLDGGPDEEDAEPTGVKKAIAAGTVTAGAGRSQVPCLPHPCGRPARASRGSFVGPSTGPRYGFCYDPGRRRHRRPPQKTGPAEVSRAWPSPKSLPTAPGGPRSPRT